MENESSNIMIPTNEKEHPIDIGKQNETLEPQNEQLSPELLKLREQLADIDTFIDIEVKQALLEGDILYTQLEIDHPQHYSPEDEHAFEEKIIRIVAERGKTNQNNNEISEVDLHDAYHARVWLKDSLEQVKEQLTIGHQLRQELKTNIGSQRENVEWHESKSQPHQELGQMYEKANPLQKLVRNVTQKKELRDAREATVSLAREREKLSQMEREYSVQESHADALTAQTRKFYDLQSSAGHALDETINGYLYQRFGKHLRSEIQSKTTEFKKQLHQEVIREYLENVVAKLIAVKAQQEITTTFSAEEWEKQLVANVKVYVENHLYPENRSPSYSSLSKQGRELYGLPEGTLVYFTKSSDSRTVTLCNENGAVIESFPREEYARRFLALLPLENISGYAVHEWDLVQERLVVQQDGAKEAHTYSGTDEIYTFFAHSRPLQINAQTGEESVGLYSMGSEHFPAGYRGDWRVEHLGDGSKKMTRTVEGLVPEGQTFIAQQVEKIFFAQNSEEQTSYFQETLREARARGWKEYEISRLLNSCLDFDPKSLEDDIVSVHTSRRANQFSKENTSPFGISIMGQCGLGEDGKSFDQRHYFSQLMARQQGRVLSTQAVKDLFPDETREFQEAFKKMAEADESMESILTYKIQHGDPAECYHGILQLLVRDPGYMHSLLQEALIRGGEQTDRSMEFFQAHAPKFYEGLLVAVTQDIEEDIVVAENVYKDIKTYCRERLVSGVESPEEKHLLFNILSIAKGRRIHIENLLENGEELSPAFAKEIVTYARSLVTPDGEKTTLAVSEEEAKVFAGVYPKLCATYKEKDSQMYDTLTSYTAFSFFARHPDQIEKFEELPTLVPEFFELIDTGGEFENNREQFLGYLFADGNLVRRAHELTAIFSGTTPLAEKTMSFIDARLEQALEKSESTYLVATASGERLPFGTLDLGEKRAVLRSYIEQSIALSRSNEQKAEASQRNKDAELTFSFKQGMYIHGLHAATLPLVYRNGNLCGEALGASAQEDSYPFHVDYSFINQDQDVANSTLAEIVGALPSNTYGAPMDENTPNMQVLLITDREKAQWDNAVTYAVSERHALMLGAVPTSEIHAALLRDPNASLPSHISACIEEEIYIPAYALETTDTHSAGDLIFSYDTYMAELARVKPYASAKDFLSQDSYLKHLDNTPQGGDHRFSLGEHMRRAAEYAEQVADDYSLDDNEKTLVCVAAKLHDIGKGVAGAQKIDNTIIAKEQLSSIQGLSADDKELVLNLIRYDELLGDIVQGIQRPERFMQVFPDPRYQRMMLCLYRSDVMAIDGNENDESVYNRWDIDTKLHQILGHIGGSII